MFLEERADIFVKHRGDNVLNQRYKLICLCICKEYIRIGKEVLNHFHIRSLKNGNANLRVLLMKARVIIV